MRPASAPWRSSPVRSRTTKSASARSCARRARRGSPGAPRPIPTPVVAAMRSSASSSSATVTWGSSGAVGISPRAVESVDQPTPIRPWRGSPVSRHTTTATSSGAHARSSVASASIFVLRERVAPTAGEVSTTTASSTPARVRSAPWNIDASAAAAFKSACCPSDRGSRSATSSASTPRWNVSTPRIKPA